MACTVCGQRQRIPSRHTEPASPVTEDSWTLYVSTMRCLRTLAENEVGFWEWSGMLQAYLFNESGVFALPADFDVYVLTYFFIILCSDFSTGQNTVPRLTDSWAVMLIFVNKNPLSGSHLPTVHTTKKQTKPVHMAIFTRDLTFFNVDVTIRSDLKSDLTLSTQVKSSYCCSVFSS